MPVSIVIPNFNGAKLLRKHLPNVLRACTSADEIIVVDDASTDDSLRVLEEFSPRVQVLRMPTNVRFARACNAGVAKASHEVVVLFNSDVSPKLDTLRVLETSFADAQIFAVGCLEEAGAERSGRSCAQFRRGMLIHARHPRQIDGNSAWASGGSMAVRKSGWKKLGGMDALYRPAYYEDIDLSYRAWKMGWKIVFSKSAVVEHHHESTNTAVFGRWKMQVMAHKNSFLFVWKNISDVRLWISHIVWLPYHVVVGGVRTKGALTIGFLRALLQLPEVIHSRMCTNFRKRSDASIMKDIACD